MPKSERLNLEGITGRSLVRNIKLVVMYEWIHNFLCLYLILRPCSCCFSFFSGKNILSPNKENVSESVVLDFKQWLEVRLSNKQSVTKMLSVNLPLLTPH